VAKGPEAFRTISEAADELGIPQHVLRFWETKFSFIRPMKRAGGRRFYRPQDLMVLKGVRALLHDEGYTIKGVQRLHKELGVKHLLAAAEGGGPSLGASQPAFAFEDADLDIPDAPTAEPHLDPAAEQGLRDALSALEAAKARLSRALQNR
jgi:DNA-binding transcriptional MerR regulator